jgi:hypothetical protein
MPWRLTNIPVERIESLIDGVEVNHLLEELPAVIAKFVIREVRHRGTASKPKSVRCHSRGSEDNLRP